MGSALRALGVAWRAARPVSQAVRDDGEAPGGGAEGGLAGDLINQIHCGGAHRAGGMVGGKEWEWECRSKKHIGGKIILEIYLGRKLELF